MGAAERGRRLFLALALSATGACTGPQPAPVPASDPAAALREESRIARAADDPERAAALLERALRIAPQDARSWLDLGRLRLDAGDPAAAAAMARKALILAGGDGELAARAQQLLDAAARP